MARATYVNNRGRGAVQAPEKIGQFRPKESSKIALITGCFNQKNCANSMKQCPHTFNQHLNYVTSELCVCEQTLPTKQALGTAHIIMIYRCASRPELDLRLRVHPGRELLANVMTKLQTSVKHK